MKVKATRSTSTLVLAGNYRSSIVRRLYALVINVRNRVRRIRQARRWLDRKNHALVGILPYIGTHRDRLPFTKYAYHSTPRIRRTGFTSYDTYVRVGGYMYLFFEVGNRRRTCPGAPAASGTDAKRSRCRPSPIAVATCSTNYTSH